MGRKKSQAKYDYFWNMWGDVFIFDSSLVDIRLMWLVRLLSGDIPGACTCQGFWDCAGNRCEVCLVSDVLLSKTKA